MSTEIKPVERPINKIPFRWTHIETIGSRPDYNSKRAKVFGGWIVRTTLETVNGASISICFLPDPLHQWEINR